MKYKNSLRCLCAMLALVLLLTGCDAIVTTEPTQESIQTPVQKPVQNPTQGTAQAPSQGLSQPTIPEVLPETIDYHQTVMDLMAYLPEIEPYSGEKKIPYDPDRKVFISLMNQDFDFYATGGLQYIAFNILTLEPYDASQIQVSFDMETEYTVDVMNLTGSQSQQEIPYRVYSILFDEDLIERKTRKQYQSCALQILDVYREARDTLRTKYYAAGEKPEEKEDFQLLQKHFEGYQKLYDDHREWLQSQDEALCAVPRENLPTFYYYGVAVYFPSVGSYEETVESALITIGTDEYTVDFGQWRFHQDYPQEIKNGIAPPGLTKISTGIKGDVYAFSDGYGSVIFDFIVNEDLTVLGMRQLESEVAEFAIKGAKISLYEKKDGVNVLKMDYFWDGHRPIDFEAGDIVRIQYLIKDDRLYLDFLCTSAVFLLDYELRNREYSLATDEGLRLNDCGGFYLWDVYFRYFEEKDMGEWHYYNGQPQNWYDDIPSKWLE